MKTQFADSATREVLVGGTPFVYRDLGEPAGVPLVLLHHLAATLDDWDPAVIDGLARTRRVIVFDNRGVGDSAGNIPDSIDAMAADAIAFLDALGLAEVDLCGFSLGGFIAQVVALNRPTLVRRLILAGTGPAGGHGIAAVPDVVAESFRWAGAAGKHPKHYLFFAHSDQGSDAADAFLERLGRRKERRDPAITEHALQRQLIAIRNWGSAGRPGQPLGSIHQQVLVVNGDNDIMVPTINSIALFHGLPNARLSIFPAAGHGGIFEYHEEFVDQATRFLSN